MSFLPGMFPLAASSDGIRLVGYKTLSVAGSFGSQAISLTGMTGRDPRAGDVVVIGWGTTQPSNYDMSIAGYTEVADLYQNDVLDSNLYVGLKVLTAADTTATISATQTDRGNTIVIFVFSGVDQTTPQDTAAVTTGDFNGQGVNPSSITPVTVGAVVLAFGHSSDTEGVSTPVYAPTDLTDFQQVSRNNPVPNHSTHTGGGWIGPWLSGAVNPADWNYGPGANIGASWNAVTMALRPAA